jgi:acyl-coenzyme A thioesterase PaaI-like protein
VVPFIPHARRLGLRLVGKQAGELVLEMPFNADLEVVPNSGLMANGAITAFMDTALGAAVYEQFEIYRRIVTLNLRVDYFEKPQPFSTVVIKTRCLKVTDHIVFVQGDAYCKDMSAHIAHGGGVLSYADMEKTP